MTTVPTATDLDRAATQWREDGWVLIEGLVDEATMDAVTDELAALDVPQPAGPTRRADQVGATGRTDDGDSGEQGSGDRFRAEQFDGTNLFPLPAAPTLNRLVVHPGIVDFAARAIGTDDLRLYQSRLWSKHGGHTDYAQPLHRDLNHSLVPARNEPGWFHLECFLYLTDVDADSGAPRLVPGRALTGSGVDVPTARRPVSRQDRPDLYELEVAAEAPRGSLLAYRSDVWHRGVDLAPGRERHVLVVAYRPGGADWIGFDAHAPLVDNRDFQAFVGGLGPDDLALFGVPRPGHPFWTAAVVEATADIYPGLDLDPWRRAIAAS